MEPEELEALLAFDYENEVRDYKESCPWSPATFVKHILAMANNEDESHIIIGVREDRQGSPRYHADGIDEESIASYDIDLMKDSVEPHVSQKIDFEVFTPLDRNGTKLVVIRIRPVLSPPVFCSRTLPDPRGRGFPNVVRAGQIFIRAGIGRAQSRTVKTPEEMANIVEKSASKLLNNLYRKGLMCPFLPAPPPAAADAVLEFYRQESGGL